MKEEFTNMNLKKNDKILNEQMIEELIESEPDEISSSKSSFSANRYNNINLNEEIIEKLIEKEKEKIHSKIPGFIILDILRCLENLNQTNFYLEFEEDTFFDDKNNDLISIFSNENLPFAVKSLILNFLLKYVLTLKINCQFTQIFDPLKNNAKNLKLENFDFKDNYVFLNQMNESKKHLNETIKLMNILILCIELIKTKEKLDFEKAYIEKNGLYDFCVSIIQGINYLCNLIINTNYIHEMYLLIFTILAFKFFEIEDFL